MNKRNLATFGALTIVVVVGLAGCNQSPPMAGTASDPAKQASGRSPHAGHDHEGWWCEEHCVPEDVCGLCDKKLAARFKADDDWCKKHDRPESQCFECHPEYEAKFVAQYEAKFGHEPPKKRSEHEGHEEDHEPHS